MLNFDIHYYIGFRREITVSPFTGRRFQVYLGPKKVYFDSKVLTCSKWDKIKRAFKE